MALKVELKPHERIIIGACVVTNTDQRARLLIDGDKIPILREKDIMTPEIADTPAKLVYLAVQLMYISPEPQINHGTYFNLVRDIVTAAPSTWPIIEGINNNILSGDMYQALKEARKLIAYEKKLLDQNAARNRAKAEARRGLTGAYIASGGDGSTSGTGRRTASALRAEFQHRRDQRIDIAGIGAVIDDRRADREPAVENRGRWRRDPGFLNVDDDIAIDPVGVIGAIAKADDVELNRRQQFQPRLGQDPGFQISGQRTGARRSSLPASRCRRFSG
jgi:flagellar biosynthesis repressor protein FlbT